MTFLPLLLVLLLAFVVPLALSRLRWFPVVVGEILAGILIGQSGLRLIHEDFTLDFLAEIGLALLMFLAGLEVDFSVFFRSAQRRSRRLKILGIAGGAFLLTLGMAVTLSFELSERGLAGNPWMISLILSTTSLGIVLPVLKERGLSPSPFGQTLIVAALMADFFTMFLITVYVAVKSHGLSFNILLIGVLFVAALLVHRVGQGRLRRRPLERILTGLSSATSQLRVQGAMALMMAFVVLSHFLGTEMILGAFLAGALVSLLSRPEDEPVRLNLDAIGFGFFIPIFFITVGIRFNFPALLQNRDAWVLTPLLLGSAYVIKILPSLLFKFSFSWKETFGAGFLLSSRLSLIIAAAGIGLKLGVIGEAANAAFILIAAFTSTVSPLLFNVILPVRKEPRERFIMISDANDIGLQVARELETHGEKVRFLEESPVRSPVPPPAWPSRTSGWEAVPPDAVRCLLILGGDDGRNLAVAAGAVGRGIEHVIAWVNDPAWLPRFKSLGVQIFSPGMYRANLLAIMAGNPDLFHLFVSSREDHQIREIYLANPRLTGTKLKDLRLGGDILVLAIRRGNELLIPHGDTRLESNDRLTVLGGLDSLARLEESLGEVLA
ncbi:MAG: cation:proton antiporter [Candidatus Aminicenantes bacterium]|nr:cation:proton antiporter [Candidatus Aminicenantes bacterium]